jgi:hypothetical protein
MWVVDFKWRQPRIWMSGSKISRYALGMISFEFEYVPEMFAEMIAWDWTSAVCAAASVTKVRGISFMEQVIFTRDFEK